MSKLTRKYSLRNTFAVLALLAATAAQASVTVTNVTVAQRPGTKLVDIGYDVANTATSVAVSLVVSNGAAVAPVVLEGMVLVQGGSLPSIGNGAITVSSFCIGKYEVTWAEWQTVRTWAAANGYDIGNVGAGSADNHPVQTVSWYDVVKWCNARSQKEGRTPVYTVGGVIYKSDQYDNVAVNASATGYRLPTEAEWEFAARGGTQSQGYEYSGGNDLNAVGWYYDNSGGGPKAVGTKAANELGLYDMAGNVWEWCADWYDKAYYGRSPDADPRGPEAGEVRVTRGGSWRSTPENCRTTARVGADPTARLNYLGFRCAISPKQQ